MAGMGGHLKTKVGHRWPVGQHYRQFKELPLLARIVGKGVLICFRV